VKACVSIRQQQSGQF